VLAGVIDASQNYGRAGVSRSADFPSQLLEPRGRVQRVQRRGGHDFDGTGFQQRDRLSQAFKGLLVQAGIGINLGANPPPRPILNERPLSGIAESTGGVRNGRKSDGQTYAKITQSHRL